jgi:DNA-directed RNA polymerase specialized sigma24 family protein
VTDFDPSRDGLSWAFGIASYEIMTLRRKQKRRREVSDDASLTAQPDGAASQEDQLADHEMAHAFDQAVQSLTQEDRVALGLATGAANSAGATHRKRKQRALERLREIWRQIYGEP